MASSDEDSAGDRFDTVCAICDNGGLLACCEGKCFRAFHGTPDSEGAEDSNCESICLISKELKVPYKCENCQYSLHQCFVCAELGSSDESSNTEVFRCNSATCRHFYHPKCVAKLLQQNDKTEQQNLKEKIAAGEPFICPAHKCVVCKQAENEKVEDLQFALCRRCPKSYHRKCLPREIIFDHQIGDGDDDEVRGWDGLLTRSRALIYCLEHEIDPELATPARTLIIRNILNSKTKRPRKKKLAVKVTSGDSVDPSKEALLKSLKGMRDKQQWSIEQQKCLIETCIEEVNKLGRKGLSMHKKSWNNLGKVLKERFGLDLTQKQMKNAYDNLKAKYIGWVYLKNKTGNIYNPQTNTFTLTDEEWEEFKKGHPKAVSLKTVPLPFPELCAQLFDGNTTNGGSKWTSTQTTSVVGSSSCHRVKPLMLTDTVIHDTGDDACSYNLGADPINEDVAELVAEPTSEPTPEPTPNPNKRAKTSKSSSITIDDLARDMQKALQYLIKGKKGPTVLECSEKLKLVGLDPVDPLFLAAFYFFGVSSDMREAWMALPPIPEVLRGWISMKATSLGLIK